MRSRHRLFLIPLLAGAFAEAAAAAGTVRFGDFGYTTKGEWFADAELSPAQWSPGAPLRLEATLEIAEDHLQALAAAGVRAESLCLLVTAERTFDADGWLRLPSDERMSTLLTPTGLPIEGGVQGAVTDRFGYGFRTPVDELLALPVAQAQPRAGMRRAGFSVRAQLPAGLPPGIYRLRLDFGVQTANRRYYDLNGGTFAQRPSSQGRITESYIYSPPVRAGGTHVSGRRVDAAAIRPRIPWILLNNYNSNGYRGIVADEDRGRFALSGRNLIQDDIILPLTNPDTGKPYAYSLEPQFPADTIEARRNIPWDYGSGELTVEVTGPDGKTVKLGTWPLVGRAGQWPTTRRTAITGWRPSGYGRYTVRASGWTADVWGNRYEGGGTYHFWIANRMTMATATFQGMAYPVGNRYGRDIGFAPAVPADVQVTATLIPHSDPLRARTVVSAGKASPAGIFGAAQGSRPLPFDEPGEYAAHVLARYTDPQGRLWVCSMRHAGVVYPPDSPIVARGKKLSVPGGKLVERGETRSEGWVEEDGTSHLAHITYPYRAGDVLLIASEGQGANKIEPVLLWEDRENPQPYDSRWQGIGITNLRIQTSNGYSPHLFPEYITDWMYYYAGAPRPGFMSRFLVAENGTRAPYWPTSPNSFGGQIAASANGDLPGDIYRLVGGVVVRPRDRAPMYAGYLASAFLLPGGSRNNRVIAPGAEDLAGPTGEAARFFLVGTRPGMVYETGAAFVPAVQIDPILPASVSFTLDYPDGRRVHASGTGDAGGSFAGKEPWILDVPGIYRYRLEAFWEGRRGIMPGLPPDGGEFYVVERGRPPDAAGLQLDLPAESAFNPLFGFEISGRSTARDVYYAAVIPGAVIDQGYIPVREGSFKYWFSPKLVNQRVATYDIAHRTTGAPQLGDVVHLTFFSRETAPDGTHYHAYARVILRGQRAIWVGATRP